MIKTQVKKLSNLKKRMRSAKKRKQYYKQNNLIIKYNKK